MVGRRGIRARVLAKGHRVVRRQHPGLQPGQCRGRLPRPLRRDRLRSLSARHQPVEQAGLQPRLVHLVGGAAARAQRAAGRAHDVLTRQGVRDGRLAARRTPGPCAPAFFCCTAGAQPLRVDPESDLVDARTCRS
ncbi:hypothetical protein G6F58_012956 [Rhizopus delemar]|nr:hypothetical protein G6F58_012956 [Rhizopus delemar]